MSREQRADDNWALLRAIELAREHRVSVRVVFNLVPKFLEATARMYGFMLQGLRETEAKLRKKNIPFHLAMGSPTDTVPAFVRKHAAIVVVCDMSPLRVPMAWCHGVANKLGDVPLYQIDAHNVVPVWIASDKQEVGARTIRKKIQEKLPQYLSEFPSLPPQDLALLRKAGGMPPAVNWVTADKSLKIDRSVKEVTWLKPGAAAAAMALSRFCKEQVLATYIHRNDPLTCTQSGLSAWLHFGQLAPQRAALAVKAAGKGKAKSASLEFLEEAVVRRELSDNFCFYNPKYDSLDGAAGWAYETLRKHSKDKREHVYTEHQLEKAKTHDALWNAAQNELRELARCTDSCACIGPRRSWSGRRGLRKR
jgi:deoxyribodipyrimidine photo-lyase